MPARPPVGLGQRDFPPRPVQWPAEPLAVPGLTDPSTGAQPRMTDVAPGANPVMPPNEFQRFVFDSTGQKLPLFGADFFSQPAGTFNPQSVSPVSGDYTLGPGDEVQIRGWGSVDIDVRTVIDRKGQIVIPRVGAINLAGVRSSQVEPTVRAAIGRLYRDFDLSVTHGQLRGITVYVVGQARQPGAYQLSGASTALSALFASGGPTPLGSMRRIQVKRAGNLVTEIDLYRFVAQGDKAADVRLQDGDTLVIPPARAFVAMTGTVSVQAVFELASDQESLSSILELSGGLPVVADPKRVFLERVDPRAKPSRSVESFALDAAGLARTLRNGDMLVVSPLTTEFGNAVILRGNVDTPVRTPWVQGMRITDLITGKAMLVTRQSVYRQNSVLMSDEASDKPMADRIGRHIDDVNLDYAVVERVDRDTLGVEVLAFNLGQALDDPASPENLTLRPGDVVTVFSANDVRVPQARRRVYVRVEGEVRRPGVYQMRWGETLPDLLEKAGGLTADAYVFGASFHREMVRQSQFRNLDQLVRQLEAQSNSSLSSMAANSNLAGDAGQAASLKLQLETERVAQQRALERLRRLKPNGRLMLGMDADASPSSLPRLRLENMDKLTVPAKPDFVTILGSVNIESALIYQAGATVKDYLRQAGATSGADLDELFILRADGSVTSDRSSRFSSVMSARVLPGDIIVLPEKTNHETAWSSFVKGAKDVSQIFFQFGLGAAAVQTLRN